MLYLQRIYCCYKWYCNKYIYTVRTIKLWNTKLTVRLKSQIMILNNQANFKTKDCAVFTDLFYKTVILLY